MAIVDNGTFALVGGDFPWFAIATHQMPDFSLQFPFYSSSPLSYPHRYLMVDWD
jgi:hypothetical protein